jgi:protein TonB
MSSGAELIIPKSRGSRLIEFAFAPFAKLFAINKFAASATMAIFITVGLFFLMVALISLGDSSIKTDNSRKLADIIMPDRDIDTLIDIVDKPEEPEQQPDDIAQPEVDLQPLAGVDVSLPKPKANFTAGGSFFRDGEYIPLFKVTPIYPRRAQERGIMGYAIVAFTITETGTVEDVVPLEGYCGDPRDETTDFRACSIFNSAASRAALKLKYKPKIVDGNAVKVFDVPHKFTFILEDDT